jgi:hypothetical protein
VGRCVVGMAYSLGFLFGFGRKGWGLLFIAFVLGVMLWGWSFGLLFGLWFLMISYATALASNVVLLAVLLLSEVVFTVVVLEAEVLGMGFRDGFAFAVGLWGGFLFFGGVHLVLIDDLALDGARDLGF